VTFRKAFVICHGTISETCEAFGVHRVASGEGAPASSMESTRKEDDQAVSVPGEVVGRGKRPATTSVRPPHGGDPLLCAGKTRPRCSPQSSGAATVRPLTEDRNPRAVSLSSKVEKGLVCGHLSSGKSRPSIRKRQRGVNAIPAVADITVPETPRPRCREEDVSGGLVWRDRNTSGRDP